MVTGVRRAELLALRWSDIDLKAGKIAIHRNYVGLRAVCMKGRQDARMRLISLDPATVEVLTQHRQRYAEAVPELGLEPSDEAFLFSYEAAWDRPYDPSGATHRYARMCKRLGIGSHLHALRHYSATELLTAGVDL
ncbi:MAG TPA: tyrosine-type recombinase/integrase, partial [Pseudonocardiaceae bacterium]